MEHLKGVVIRVDLFIISLKDMTLNIIIAHNVVSKNSSDKGSIENMKTREEVIKALEQCTTTDDICDGENCPYFVSEDYGCKMLDMKIDALALLKEQEDMGKELTDAMELIHKKNERIKKLEEQIETLTKWRANAGAFD